MSATFDTGRRLLSSGLWALIARVVAALAGFATNLLVVRLLPPSDVGLYFLLVSVAALGSTIGQAGLQVAVVRLVAEAVAIGNESHGRRVIATSIRLVAVCAAAVGIAVATLGPVLLGALSVTGVSSISLALVGVWILSLSLISVIAESFRGLHRYRLASMLGTTIPNAATLCALAVLVVLAISPSLNTVVAVVASVMAGVSAFGVAKIAAHVKEADRPPSGLSRELLSAGLPLLVTILAIFAMTQLDLWLVGSYCGVADTATYGAAARLVALVMMPMLIGNAALQPVVADLNGRAETRHIERMVRATAAATGLTALGALVFLCFEAEAILGLAYGDYYRDGASILILLSMGQTVNALAGPGAVVLMMTGAQRQVMAISLFCGAILAIGGVLAVGSYGSVGVAAVAASIAGFHGLLCLMMVRRLNGIWVHASITELAVAIKQARAVTA